MRVALDVTALLGPRTGVGVFTTELAERLAARRDIELTGYAVTWRGRQELAGVAPAGLRLVSRPLAAQPLRRLWGRGDSPVIEWWTGSVDVVHGPNFVVPPTRRAAEVVTVHDLTCVRFPELCTADVLQYPRLIRRAIGRGAWVHAVSQFVADEVVEHFKVPPDRVVVAHNGAPSPPAVGPGTDAATGRALAGAERYVLSLGTIEPRKDLPSLVRAFEAVADEDPELRLVVAGQDGWGVDAYDAAVNAAEHRDRIVGVGWVDDRQRTALLRGATVFAYPSMYEGFGLPPLEAMAAGTPVVSTTAGALPEVMADAALLVTPGDVDALAAGVQRLLTDDDERSRLVAAGHANLVRFTWDHTVDQLVELYAMAQAGAPPAQRWARSSRLRRRASRP